MSWAGGGGGLAASLISWLSWFHMQRVKQISQAETNHLAAAQHRFQPVIFLLLVSSTRGDASSLLQKDIVRTAL